MKTIDKITLLLFPFISSLVACERPAPNGLMPIHGTSVNLVVTGDAVVTPDIAIITGGLEAKGANAKEALSIQNNKMSAIIDALKTLGIDQKDIGNEQVSLNPVYFWTPKEGQKIKAYQATNIIKIKVRDKQKVSQVLDAMVKDGTNRIDSVAFKTENKDAPAQIARKDALEKANARADAYAKAAGMKVFKIVSISEVSSQTTAPGAQTVYETSARMVDAKISIESAPPPPPPIAEGQVESQVTLNVTYEFRK